MAKHTDLYANRRLSDGYPDMQKLAFEARQRSYSRRPDHTPTLGKFITYLGRLVDLQECRNLLVVGCGPQPQTVQFFLKAGLNAFGVEPIPESVRAAAEFLEDPERVVVGTAEHLPFPDSSQHVVILESVMEHVDSPIDSLKEVYRVLAPGGIVHILTTNRHLISLSGRTGEYTTRFYNWFPAIVKECFVFHHLHYMPTLARYSQRPAVHWYCYTDLCHLGRQAGFAQFYSLLDLMRPEDPGIARSRFRRRLLHTVQLNPWLRALALTQLGGQIIMLKRRTEPREVTPSIHGPQQNLVATLARL